MDRKQFLTYLSVHFGRIHRVLNLIPEKQWNYRPIKGTRTVSELVGHLINHYRFIQTSIKGTVPPKTFFDTLPTVTNRSDTLGTLNTVFEETWILVNDTKDTVWNKTVTYPFTGTTLPLWSLCRNMVENQFHYLGQLCVYGSLLNLSVPPTFSPTGYETWTPKTVSHS